jgi:hypothetical protein
MSDATLEESDWKAAHPPNDATSSTLAVAASAILADFTEAPENEKSRYSSLVAAAEGNISLRYRFSQPKG